MRPDAQVAAAIDCLDSWIAGEPAEKVLTNWARSNRFAGSKDRAAIRDLVYQAIRQIRSLAWIGGAENGRAIMKALILARGEDPATYFTGQGYGPAVLDDTEKDGRSLDGADRSARLDCPDWILPKIDEMFGAEADRLLSALKERAPLWLRVKNGPQDTAKVKESLLHDGIDCEVHASGALKVVSGERAVARSASYLDGDVEIQDLGAQLVVSEWDVPEGADVLDYCAGGGGKSLALAARGNFNISAYDIDFQRMKDLGVRAERAGAEIRCLQDEPVDADSFDVVVCDVPCSGSGAWRRNPEGKWRLHSERLNELLGIQADILDRAALLVRPGGKLFYVTCSLFQNENDAQISRFLDRNAQWSLTHSALLSPFEDCDGFFTAHLTRER